MDITVPCRSIHTRCMCAPDLTACPADGMSKYMSWSRGSGGYKGLKPPPKCDSRQLWGGSNPPDMKSWIRDCPGVYIYLSIWMPGQPQWNIKVALKYPFNFRVSPEIVHINFERFNMPVWRPKYIHFTLYLLLLFNMVVHDLFQTWAPHNFQKRMPLSWPFLGTFGTRRPSAPARQWCEGSLSTLLIVWTSTLQNIGSSHDSKGRGCNFIGKRNCVITRSNRKLIMKKSLSEVCSVQYCN